MSAMQLIVDFLHWQFWEEDADKYKPSLEKVFNPP
jgi:hypothetical protein